MKRLRLFLAALAMVVGLSGALPAVALADDAKSTVCTALRAGQDCSKDPAGSVSINNVISTTVNLLSWLVGVAAVIMIIIGGFRFVTAGGDSNQVSSARNTIIYALVGLVVVALAQAIVKFVVHKV